MKPATQIDTPTNPRAHTATPLLIQKSKTLKWIKAELGRLLGSKDAYCKGKAAGLKSAEVMLQNELEQISEQRRQHDQHAKLVAALRDELEAIRVWQSARGIAPDVRDGFQISIAKIRTALANEPEGE